MRCAALRVALGVGKGQQLWRLIAIEGATRNLSDAKRPPDEPSSGPNERPPQGSLDDENAAGTELRGKAELPYRPVQGLNLPYPKITDSMQNFVFREMKSFEEIEDAVFELWDRLTMREVDAAYNALKRLNAYPPASLMDRLAQKTMELSEEVTFRNIASIFLSAARTKYYNHRLFDCLAREGIKKEKLEDCHGSFCGTVVYAIGALQRHFQRSRPPSANEAVELYFPLQMKLVEALVDRALIIRDEDGRTNKNIANFMYGLAMMKYRHEPILNLLAEEAMRVERMSIYNEQEVSNMVYSMGILNFRHDQLLAHFCELLLRTEWLKEWTEQGLSNAIYGFALLRYRPPNETMFALIWETCREHRIRRFHNQHLMNLIYGLVSLGVKSYRVLKCLLDELLSRRHRYEFMLTGISSIVYSFANAGIFVEGLKIFLQDLTNDTNLPQLTDWAITNLVQSFGKFPDDPELLPFFQRLMKEAVNGERMSRYTERHFALILFGLSNSSMRKGVDPEVIAQIVDCALAPSLLPSYTNQGLANVVYALTHLSYVHRDVHDRVAAEATRRVKHCEGVALATFVYSWGLIPYRDEAFLAQLTQKLLTDGVVETYSEQMLGNLLFGLVRLKLADSRVYDKLIRRIKHPDIWERFLYVTTPACIEELLRTEWIDDVFREELRSSLREIYGRRDAQQTHTMST